MPNNKPTDLQERERIVNKIKKLPVNEIKYHLFLILKAVENKDCPDLIQNLDKFVDALNIFMTSTNPNPSKEIVDLQNAYQNLCDAAGTNSYGLKLGYALINLGSVLIALITGVIGGLIGGTVGFFRAFATCNNPILYLLDGFATGAAFGASLGFRAPKKLLKDELTRQLKLCVDAIGESIENRTEILIQSFPHYEQNTKAFLLGKYFNNNEKDYQAFLNSEQTFSIQTIHARFLSGELEGYLGHHAQIVINLPNQPQPLLIEFVPDSEEGDDDIDNRKLTQNEERRVSGKTIVEMIALHNQLRVSDPCNLYNVFTKMKVGERDCLGYVNRILVGTNQNVTTCRRFMESDTWVGRNIVGFFVKALSPFSQEILDPVGECTI